MANHRMCSLLSLAALVASAAGANAQDPVRHGKTLYTTHCLRCHGEDGTDLSYPGIKSLAGVTRRMSGEEVLTRSTAFAGVQFQGETGAALVAFLATLGADGYAHPELLVETEWVAQHATDPNVRLIDVRSAEAYSKGHIPGAVPVDERPLRNPEDRTTYLPSPATFAALMGKAGVANDTHVVIYDDQGGRLAARLWYVLNAYGHSRVSLVNAGWTKWTAEKRSVSTETPAVPATTFTARVTPALTCPSEDVLAQRPGVVVLDTRSANEYRGGRIPGAVNVEWKENLTGPEMTFKPATALRQLYEKAGLTPDKEIVAHCASGGRAAQTLFTLKLLGYPKVRVYYGSFSDYTGRPGAPVEK
jgi:thiosulfate/3-mercaptopyruvate sulfurtransferase